jgi:hypothetical protein
MAARRLARILVTACITALLSPWAPGVAGEADWPEAVDRLAREKTLAESCAAILKTFADGAPMARVQGERLYARARADVDGLVRLFIADLASERPLAESPELRHRLEAVVAQRRALCRHVDAAVGATLRAQPGRAGVADLLAQGSSDSKSFMIDAAVQIWNAYRQADQAGRAAIVARIEAVRWLPYGEIPA